MAATCSLGLLYVACPVRLVTSRTQPITIALFVRLNALSAQAPLFLIALIVLLRSTIWCSLEYADPCARLASTLIKL